MLVITDLGEQDRNKDGITNVLVPTLRVGMPSGRFASLTIHLIGVIELKSGKHFRLYIESSFLPINGREASGMHSHAKRGNESLPQIRYNQFF